MQKTVSPIILTGGVISGDTLPNDI
jgi:hypothetical protein